MSTASPSPSQGASRGSLDLSNSIAPQAVIQGHGAGLHSGAGTCGQAHLAEALDQRALLSTQPGAVAVGHGQVHLPTVAPDGGGMCGHPVRKQPGGRVCQWAPPTTVSACGHWRQGCLQPSGHSPQCFMAKLLRGGLSSQQPLQCLLTPGDAAPNGSGSLQVPGCDQHVTETETLNHGDAE